MAIRRIIVDQRPASRVRTIMQGRIVFNNRSATLDCVIRNLSESGAKLELSCSVTLPDRFELVIPRKGETRRARIVWRKDDLMGIAFEKAAEQAPEQDSMAARLKSAQDENSRLRQRLAELTSQTGS
jgi:hypothetical protein